MPGWPDRRFVVLRHLATALCGRAEGNVYQQPRPAPVLPAHPAISQAAPQPRPVSERHRLSSTIIGPPPRRQRISQRSVARDDRPQNPPRPNPAHAGRWRHNRARILGSAGSSRVRPKPRSASFCLCFPPQQKQGGAGNAPAPDPAHCPNCPMDPFGLLLPKRVQSVARDPLERAVHRPLELRRNM